MTTQTIPDDLVAAKRKAKAISMSKEHMELQRFDTVTVYVVRRNDNLFIVEADPHCGKPVPEEMHGTTLYGYCQGVEVTGHERYEKREGVET